MTGLRRDDLKQRAKYENDHGIDPFKTLLPEVRDRIRQVIAALRSVRPDFPIDVCGNHAADLETAESLFAMGVDNISVAPDYKNLFILPLRLNYRRYDALQQAAPEPAKNPAYGVLAR